MLWVGSNCIIWAGAGSRWSLLKKFKKKILPCGLKIVQHSPSAEWRSVLAGHHVGVDAAVCRLGHGAQAWRAERGSLGHTLCAWPHVRQVAQ